MPDNWNVRPCRLIIAVLLLAAALATHAPASEPISESARDPAASGDRVLFRFDFEERDDGNYEDLPMHFSRVSGLGLPHWVRGKLATDAARSGQFSFRLDINGGSALYRSSAGLLPMTPGGLYRVSGYVRTTPLTFARARLTAYCVDTEGRTIADSVRYSEPFVSPADDPNGWHRLSVQTSTTNPRAAWLIIEVGLLQPGAGGTSIGDETETDNLLRFRQDVRGRAWFDDLTVSRVPTVALEREASGGVFHRGQPVRFAAVAGDPAVDQLVAQARILDAAGRQAWQGSGRIVEDTITSAENAGSEPVTPRKVRFEFDAGRLPPGWYEAVVTVGEADAMQSLDPVTVRQTAFVVLADDAESPPIDDRFTADGTHLPVAAWPELPNLLSSMAAGRVELAVWGGPHRNDAAQEAASLDAVSAELARRRIRVTAAFAGLPPELIRFVGGDDLRDLADVFSSGEKSESQDMWHSSLAFLVARHAHQVDRWQVGTVHDADRFADDLKLRQVYAQFSRVIGSLASDAEIGLSWPARRDMRALSDLPPPAVSLRVPVDVTPRQIPLYVAEAASAGRGIELSLHVEPIDADRYGRTEHLSDLARRVTYALASGVGRVTVPLPFVVRMSQGVTTADSLLRPTFEPTEDLVVLRTLLSQLSGLEYHGRVAAGEVGQNVEAFLFAEPGRGRHGTLVIWTPSTGGASQQSQQVDLVVNLAPGARQVDLWGNATRIDPSDINAIGGRATVAVGSMPSLIVGVDTRLTKLRQTVRLDNPMIESSLEPHTRRLQLTNTFDVPLSGTIRLRPPEGWSTTFPRSTFTLRPGESLSRLIELQIPYNSDAGIHRIEAEIRLRDSGELQVLRVPLDVRVGLQNVGLRTLARRDGSDLVVEQTITNYGNQPIDYTAFVLVPRSTRQERLVLQLAPGQSTTKRFRFQGAASLPAGTTIRSGLRELEGTRILNDRVEL